MPLMAISIESMLENYPPSPHELLWKKNVLIFGWVLFFLKSGVLSLLHKLGLNVVIMQKKIQWHKNILAVKKISLKCRNMDGKTLGVSDVFNYILNSLN